MAASKQITWVLLLLFTYTISASEEVETSEELVQSESKDGKLEIIKQIKKVNDDGSYTIGYEADDGSFKIESRDVLGNIKGTYGYIDDTGEIKRVSYSTSNNGTETVVPKTDAPSVVQRIPRVNRTSSTTRRPGVVYPNLTTQSTPTSTNVIQAIPRRRMTTTTTSSTSTTTEKAAVKEFIQAAVEASKSTTMKPANIIYATPASVRPVNYQNRPILRSTSATQTETQKSEGQLIRPETITSRPTDLPIYRRLVLRNPILENEASNIKPVTEEPEVRGNLLRRQLTQERSFDPQQHVFNLQQSLGGDVTDVYSASVTTGTPRPLFTTTVRPKTLSSTTYSPIHRPSIRFQHNYRNIVRENNPNPIAQETSTTESSIPENKYNTPAPIPVVQIPANRNAQEPLVAIRHPFHGGTILVPVSQLQGRDVRPEVQQIPQAPQRYVLADQQYLRETSQVQQRNPANDPHNIPIYIRRVPPQNIRSIPVQVDENGFVREIQQEVAQRIPYPVQVVQPTQAPKRVVNNEVVDNAVDEITPPVSTRDLQKLLEQLIVRQSRLERLSELTDPTKHPELYQRYQQPYYVGRNQENQYVQQQQQQQRQQYYPVQTQVAAQQQAQAVYIHPRDVYPQEQYGPVTYPPETQQYTSNRRVARLLPSPNHHQIQHHPQHHPQQDDDFLPPEVREMLLLRMLQLAINPSLPLDVPDLETMITTPAPEPRKKGARNVQILGEEEEPRRPNRIKRYWNYNK